ncbi:MAG: thiamine pyrophosphate-binding protein [Quisquiliibacterium sp.]
MTAGKQPPSTTRSGGHVLADALAIHGVDTVFGVPGESYLDVLDGLHNQRERIKFVICRQEGGAAFMADAYAKLTGKPGVLMVTRGPGATNASVGIHTARQDSTPMIVLVGQVANDCIEREAFQEIDYRRMFGEMAKWVGQIDRADRIPEYIAHAFQTATSGRPGPVVLALPEDMLTEQVSAQDTGAFTPVRAAPPPAQLAQVREMLENAQRPIVIVGGSGWNPQGVRDLQTFASDNALPVGCAFRFQDLFDNNHPNYVGDVGIGINPKLAARIRESDLVLAIGPRLGEMTTSGYTLFGIPVPSQPMVHVHSGAEELGRVYQAAVMINSGMPEIAAALAAIKVDSSAWRDQLAPARADYEAWQQRPPAMQKLSPALDLWEVVQILRAKLPVDSVITNGAGNFATWAHRFWRYAPLSDHPQGQTRSQLAPTSGAMGAGVPSAIAAKIAQPDRTVVCFAGDGDFLMTGQELATAAQYQAGVVVVLFDNGMYGTIRMHQEREYPARVLGSELANPDFARFCEAFGGLGLRVESTAQVGPALDKALEFTRRENRPALIHMKVDPEAITPNLTLSQVREGAGKR